VVSSDPNAPGQPRWPRYDPAAEVLLQLDVPVRVIKAPYPAAVDVCSRWAPCAVCYRHKGPTSPLSIDSPGFAYPVGLL
jgi:hypothetical protein